MRLLTADEARKLLDAAVGHPNEALFVLALATGMRRGELLGLKWQDVDFATGILYVRRVLNRMPTVLGDRAGLLVESEPKTRHSRRSIILAGFAFDALRRHKARQEEWRQAAGDSWEDSGYVFTTPLGRYIHPNSLNNQFKALLEKAGLPDIRFHDLRHSVASLLLARGVHPKVVQEILGHSQISITMDVYSHVLPTMHQDAMRVLNRAFVEDEDGEGDGDGEDNGDDGGGAVLARR
jgi:integrase